MTVRSFDGNDYLRMAQEIHAAQPYTVAIWFQTDIVPTQDDGEWQIWEQVQGSNDFLSLRIEDGAGNVGKLQSSLKAAGSFSGNLLTNNALSDSGDITGWHHAFMARATNDHELMLDGDTANKDTSVEDGDTSMDHNKTFWGAFGTGVNPDSDFLDGALSWSVHWNVRLTEAEGVELSKGRHPLTMRPNSILVAFPLWGEHSGEIPFPMGGTHDQAFLVPLVTGATTAEFGPPIELWTPGRRVFPAPNIVSTGNILDLSSIEIPVFLPSISQESILDIGVVDIPVILPSPTIDTGDTLDLSSIEIPVFLPVITQETILDIGVVDIPIILPSIVQKTTLDIGVVDIPIILPSIVQESILDIGSIEIPVILPGPALIGKTILTMGSIEIPVILPSPTLEEVTGDTLDIGSLTIPLILPDLTIRHDVILTPISIDIPVLLPSVTFPVVAKVSVLDSKPGTLTINLIEEDCDGFEVLVRRSPPQYRRGTSLTDKDCT